jgi:SAM-dependent methyltransferase
VNIKNFQKQWNALGTSDPMWAVLTDPAKKGNRWDRDEFFASGVRQVEAIGQRLKKLKIDFPSGTAIDFGCGLGRLTQALCPHFEKCIGIDLSESMVQKAREYNQFPDKCAYLVNAEPDLRQIPDASADFILSLIALQHTATPFQEQYVGDFIRILKPGGIAYFQVIQPTFLRSLIPDSLTERYRNWKHHGEPFISMYGLAESKVRQTVAAHGASVLDCHVEPYGGFKGRWKNYCWCVRK